MSASAEPSAPKRPVQSKHFEKLVSGFLNAKYSNRPQVPGGKDFAEPDLPGGAHLVFDSTAASSGNENSGSIFLGPKTSASPKTYGSITKAVESMNRANILGIVNCTTHVSCYLRGKSDVKYCVIPVDDDDSSDLLRYFMNATTFMHSILSQGSNVLVHCEVGVSRSSSVVIAYLIRFHGLSRDDAYIAVKKRRPKVNPNQGFWKQLETFEAIVANDDHGGKSKTESVSHNDEAQVEGDTLSIQQSLIQESNLLYTTCRDVESRITEADCYQWLFPSRMNEPREAYYRRCLSVCIEHVVVRGLLAVDIEWLVFCCKQLWSGEPSVMDPTDVQALVEDSLSNPGAAFDSSWDGEISTRQAQKILLAIDESVREDEGSR